MKIAMFPGSFDPITKGHIDIIKRSAKLFDKLYVVVLDNVNKKGWFSKEERLELIKASIEGIDNVVVDSSSSTSIEYATRINACAIIRGVRSIKDYEYEMAMANINAHANSNIETVFLIAHGDLAFVSSSMIKEMVIYHMDIDEYVSDVVKKACLSKM